eukprot:CAMPEP_0195154660 /NCGR_PEP_ID=MMETSP0448-20130528/183765_1 /TAXON_ID=66468 /ORGANISM="Heterocapsa triquestra, Strain CCMP 448" /LENGTH=227 /DNA_ID=CAMNT_0040193437 /DNA_START=1 /DNA_END=685 /DNA_ORIENTATION=-
MHIMPLYLWHRVKLRERTNSAPSSVLSDDRCRTRTRRVLEHREGDGPTIATAHAPRRKGHIIIMLVSWTDKQSACTPRDESDQCPSRPPVQCDVSLSFPTRLRPDSPCRPGGASQDAAHKDGSSRAPARATCAPAPAPAPYPPLFQAGQFLAATGRERRGTHLLTRVEGGPRWNRPGGASQDAAHKDGSSRAPARATCAPAPAPYLPLFQAGQLLAAMGRERRGRTF